MSRPIKRNPRVVVQTFRPDNDGWTIPRGYIWIQYQVVFLRDALIFVRDNGLIYRWRSETFGDNSPTSYDLPILRTMRFKPWTAFSIPRIVKINDGRSISIPSGFGNSNTKVRWFTYFCFSNELDMAKFVFVWR